MMRPPFAGSGVYSGAQSALATVSEVVRQEANQFGIDVVGVVPSFVATDFYDRMIDELDDFKRTAVYVDLYELLEELRAVEVEGPGIASPETVGATILEAAKGDDPKNRSDVGVYAKLGRGLAVMLPELWRSPALRAGIRFATSAPAE